MRTEKPLSQRRIADDQRVTDRALKHLFALEQRHLTEWASGGSV